MDAKVAALSLLGMILLIRELFPNHVFHSLAVMEVVLHLAKIILKSMKPTKYIQYVFPWGDTNESRVQAIQSEIMTNGPVLAIFFVFSDFSISFNNFPRGVYHRSKEATNTGGHAVRIIGWGTSEEGEDYWLVANSW